MAIYMALIWPLTSIGTTIAMEGDCWILESTMVLPCSELRTERRIQHKTELRTEIKYYWNRIGTVEPKTVEAKTVGTENRIYFVTEPYRTEP